MLKLQFLQPSVAKKQTATYRSITTVTIIDVLGFRAVAFQFVKFFTFFYSWVCLKKKFVHIEDLGKREKNKHIKV